MAQGGQAVKVSGGDKVGAGGVDHAGNVQGRGGASGDSVDKYGPHPKREGGVEGHRAVRGTVEGLFSGG